MRIWILGGGGGMIIAILGIARSLGNYENKPLAIWITYGAFTLGFVLIGLAVRDWLKLPERRPIVVPDRYGPGGTHGSEGLYLVNSGVEQAYGISIDPIPLGRGWRAYFDDALERLGDNGFLGTMVRNGNIVNTRLDAVWRDLLDKDSIPDALPFVIRYRDLEGRIYRTEGILRQNHKRITNIEAVFVKQKIVRWWSRS